MLKEVQEAVILPEAPFKSRLCSVIEKVKKTPGRAISTSQAQQWLDCRRAWAFARTTEFSGDKSFFVVGKAVHAGLETYALTKNKDLAMFAATKELVVDNVDYTDQIPLVTHMINGYLSFDADNPDYEIIATELEFEMFLGDITSSVVLEMPQEQLEGNLKIKGVIDFIAVTKKPLVTLDGTVIPKGELILGEYKTAKQSGNVDYELAIQPTLYMLAAEKLLERPVKYIVYNTLYKKLPKEPAILKNGDVSAAAITTTKEIYGKALIDVYGSIENAPEKCINLYHNLKAGTSNFFERVYVGRTAAELESLDLMLQSLVRDINADYAYLMENPNNPDYSKCYAKPTRYCKTMCEYRDMCISVNKQEPIVIPNKFQVNLIGVNKEEGDN